jgi:hypothetical protein
MGQMEYDDGLIACSEDGLTIRRYGLFLGPKDVPYTEIREVEQVELRGFSFGKWRIWGSTDLRHWFNMDWRRPKKQAGLVLYLDDRMKPVITPDDPQRVVEVLRTHGIDVTES